MISFTELNKQNHKITELSNVLNHLIADRGICDTSITKALFFDYVQQVKAHLSIEERQLYQKLLIHRDKKINKIATRFLSGSTEIKRVFKRYLKRWCTPAYRKNQELRIKNHDKFIEHSNAMFALVLKRIEDEVENFYPVVRKVYGNLIEN